MKITRIVRRAGAAVFAMAVALLLPSCFEAHSTIHLKKDGSGTIENRTIMSAQMVGMMNMAAQEGGAKVKNPLTDEEDMKKQAAKMGEGVEFVKVEPLKFEDGRQGAVATYKFADIRKVKMEPGQGPPGGDEGQDEGKASEPIRFDFTPGDKAKLSVIMPPKAKKEAAEPVAEAEPAAEPAEGEPNAAGAEEANAMAMMAPMMQGLKMSMAIEVEGTITDSTATNREGNKVTVMDIDMGKLVADKEFTKKMKNPDDMKDFAKFAEIAKGAGAVIEPKDQFTIEFE